MNRNSRPVVLVDMDGTINNWVEHFYTLFNTDYPHLGPRDPEDQTTYDMFAGADNTARAAILEIMDRPGFYADLAPYPGAAEALNLMLDRFDVFLCTSPWLTNPTCVTDKYAWADRHLGRGWGGRTILTMDKTVVGGALLLDDKPNIRGAATPQWVQAFFDQPYNRTDESKPRLHYWDGVTPDRIERLIAEAHHPARFRPAA